MLSYFLMIIIISGIFFQLTSQSCVSVAGKTGKWFTHLGKIYPCATTSKYYNTQDTACGCNTTFNSKGYIGLSSSTIYIATASSSVFSSVMDSFCGSGCGVCFNMVPTGDSVDGRGTSNPQNVTVMVTGLCSGNSNWDFCSFPTNFFGYGAHFELLDFPLDSGNVSSLGWDNAEVWFVRVSCPLEYQNYWATCDCYNQANSSSPESYSDLGSKVYAAPSDIETGYAYGLKSNLNPNSVEIVSGEKVVVIGVLGFLLSLGLSILAYLKCMRGGLADRSDMQKLNNKEKWND